MTAPPEQFEAGEQYPARGVYEVTPEPLSVDTLVQSVLTKGDGAVVTFVGTVRDNSDGRRCKRSSMKLTPRWPKPR